MHSQSFGKIVIYGWSSWKWIPLEIGHLWSLNKLKMWKCDTLEEFSSKTCNLNILRESIIYRCMSLEKLSKGMWRLWSMHFQSFRGIMILWMHVWGLYVKDMGLYAWRNLNVRFGRIFLPDYPLSMLWSNFSYRCRS